MLYHFRGSLCEAFLLTVLVYHLVKVSHALYVIFQINLRNIFMQNNVTVGHHGGDYRSRGRWQERLTVWQPVRAGR